MAICGTPFCAAISLTAKVDDEMVAAMSATALSCDSSLLAAVTASFGSLLSSSMTIFNGRAQHTAGRVDEVLLHLQDVALLLAERRSRPGGRDDGADDDGVPGGDRGRRARRGRTSGGGRTRLPLSW